MHLPKWLGFSLLLLTALLIPALSLRTQEKDSSSDGHKGTVPRSSAEKYNTHGTRGGVSIGAELLTHKQVTQEFVADVNSCCIVVQIAVYPNEKEPLNLLRDDFALAVEGTDIAVRPQNAAVLSAKLARGSNGGVTTAASVGAGVAFGTYTDPATGQQVHERGVVTSASVGVGVGGNGSPSATERDREIIEQELSEKSLPEAKISVPVSGFLYFSVPKQKTKTKARTKYRLQYSLKDETLVLSLN